MTRWISAGKGKHGLRYREHPTRTVGVAKSKRPVRYYSSVYMWQGKSGSDAFGWEDEFPGGIQGIEVMAAQLTMNRKTQVPPFTYKEILASRVAELQAEEDTRLAEQQSQEQDERLVFANLFKEYCTFQQHKVSLRDEKNYFKNWIAPSIGTKHLDDIRLLDLERIRKQMLQSGRALQSVIHVKKIIRQVYHFALDHELWSGVPPTKKFLVKQKLNNARKRYLIPEQVADLLVALKKRSEASYQLAVVSVYTGMRFGEIAALQWQHVLLDQGFILVMDPKNNEERAVFINEPVRVVFDSLVQGKPEDLVFPNRKGAKRVQMSDSFDRTIAELGFNEGVTDRRLRVVFHTLRHSCGSWLANEGYNLQVIAKVLGHKTTAMTQRYSHISDQTVRDAIGELDKKIEPREQVIPLALK